MERDLPLHLADMTYPEAATLRDAGAVGFLPTGATEAHGPHLPLSTDVIISRTSAPHEALPRAPRETPLRSPGFPPSSPYVEYNGSPS